MRNYFYPVCLMLSLTGCRKEYPEPEDKNLIGGYTSLSFGTRYLSHSGNNLHLETDIGFFYNGEGWDDTDVPDSVFQDMAMFYDYAVVESVEKIAPSSPAPYSNLILMDLSGDWNEYDSFNAKTRSLSKSIRDAKSKGYQVAFASFARDGYYESDASVWVYDTCSNAFNETADNLCKIVYDKYWEYQGTSNVFDAIDRMLDYTNVFADSSDNRNITVITHEYPDLLDSITADDIIAKANACNIKINILTLADNHNWELVRIALQTGGFVQMVSSTVYHSMALFDVVDQGAPIMAAMDRILSGNFTKYRVKLNVQKTSGSWFSGSSTYDAWQTLERYADGSIKVNNYIPFYVDVP